MQQPGQMGPNQAMPRQGQKVSIMKKMRFKSNNTLMIVAALLVVGAGVASGWYLSGTAKGSLLTKEEKVAPGAKTDGEVGLTDEETFRDSEEGVLEAGGIDGEGTHHLVRDGGPSQYVYLTSTVIDLESFKGKKVRVWGETFKGKKAGYLMDVGKIKLLE
jgi:hypothetical protein